METIGQRLTHAIKLSGLELTTVWSLAKITKGSLSQWMNDQVSPEHAKHITVTRLCEVLEIRPEWLLDGKLPMRPGGGTDSASAEVPIWNARAAAGIGINNEHAKPIGSIHFRARSLQKKGITEPHAIYVDGDSMRPRLKSGDAVVYDAADCEIKNGRVYVLELEGETLIKRLYLEPDGAHVRIVSDNSRADPAWADRIVPLSSVRIAGRMRWIGSWDD